MAFRSRAGTLQLHSASKDLDVKVAKFLCHDETTLGKHHKKWSWSFAIGGSTQDWEVKIDEAVVGNSTMHFTVDGKDIFKNKIQQDFIHKLPVRGQLQLDKAYEIKSMNSNDEWYEATLTKARDDGRYEAEVLMRPDEYGQRKKMHYPLVEANWIRDPVSKKIVEIPQTMLELKVRKDDVLLPELTINNNAFTSYLCVPSPAPKQDPAVIKLEVGKDRDTVKADVGHGKLKQALDATRGGKVCSKAVKKTKLKSEWYIQIGAFGEHHIVAETKSAIMKSKDSKEISITVDGNLVVGGAAADLGAGNEWCVDVAIQGSVILKYTLHKTNVNGVATDETTEMTKKMIHSNTIRITCPDTSNLEKAVLECDEVEFSDLDRYKAPPSESPIDGSIETFESTHGIQVPHAMEEGASSGGFASDFQEFISGGSGLFSMFTRCDQPSMFTRCNQPNVDETNHVVIGAGSAPDAVTQRSPKVDLGLLSYPEALVRKVQMLA